MTRILHASIFNKLKPMLQLHHYSKVNYNTFRPHEHLLKRSLSTISTDLKQSIKNQTHVSTILATHLLSKKLDSNVVFSPFSLHVVLSLLAVGSKGRTLDQLLAFLKANNTCELNSLYSQLVPLILTDGSAKGGPRLSVANGLWVEKTLSLKPSFKEIVDNMYKAACKQVDFQKPNEVANEVNLWAEKQTNGLIKQVLDAGAIKDLTSLIFANALYFKGVWEDMFKKSHTKELDFHLLNGNKVQVPFMTNTERHLVREYRDFKVLGLPYSQGADKRQFTMYFFLPNAKDGLQSLVTKISSTHDFLDSHLPRHKVLVRKFLLPKFKISIGFEASNMLKELGLELPFLDVDEFTNMVDLPVGDTLYVSSIYQKSFVEVNEKGTEAAVVTGCQWNCGSPRHAKNDFIDFVADHPFVFLIREDVTGVVLFMGHVTDPTVGHRGS